ncbi:MAG: helix-turn-helix domain-containing protein [archaeon]
MHEATLRIRSSAPFAAVTDGTDAVLELYCNDHSDLLFVSGADPETMLARIADRIPVQDSVIGGGQLVVITKRCLKSQDRPTLERYLTKTDSLMLPPIRYEDGRKIGRILALDPGNLTELYADLAADFAVTVESKREVTGLQETQTFVSMADALPTLTARQRQVFLRAHRDGYYEIPRETTLSDISAEIDIGRRTTEEHLRRAERKLVDAIIEFL